MSLLQEIENYIPGNQQEKSDKEHTKTLMVYHNIYDSWSWIGGHADGEEDLCAGTYTF